MLGSPGSLIFNMYNQVMLNKQIAAIAAAGLILSGCGGPQSQTPQTKAPARPVVGVSLLTQSHTFYKDLEDAMRAEAAARDLDIVFNACEMDPAKQASQIEDFIAQHVAALVVAPCDSTAIVPYVQKAQSAGIPVFSADIAVNGASVVSLKLNSVGAAALYKPQRRSFAPEVL